MSTSDCYVIEFARNKTYEEDLLLAKSNVKLVNDEPDCCIKKLKAVMKCLKNVKHLELVCKNMTIIPKEFFAANLKIKYLTICGEKIVELGEGLFVDLTRLVELNLVMRHWLFYPSLLLLSSRSLKKLVIVASFANDLMIDRHMRLDNIKELNLENFENNLPYPLADANNFKILETMERLKLSCVTLKQKFQYNVYHLKELILVKSAVSFAGLYGLSATIPSLENLYFEECELNLRQNLILRKNDNMKYLSIISCKLESIPRELLICYGNLIVLNLKGNIIKSVDNDSFSMNKKLVALDLSYNEISCLDPDCFGTLQKLVVLNLQHNEISNSCMANRPLLFENMLALKHLNFLENPIIKLSVSLLHKNSKLEEIAIEKDKIKKTRKFNVIGSKDFDEHVYHLFKHD